MQALVDRTADRIGVARDPDRKGREREVVSGVVQRKGSLVRDAEDDGRILAVDIQYAQSQPSPRGQRLGHVAEEMLVLLGHELGLVAARAAVESDESVEHRGALAVACEAERDAASRLESAELAP